MAKRTFGKSMPDNEAIEKARWFAAEAQKAERAGDRMAMPLPPDGKLLRDASTEEIQKAADYHERWGRFFERCGQALEACARAVKGVANHGVLLASANDGAAESGVPALNDDAYFIHAPR